MEVNDIKNIFFFIIGILWFVFSVYIHNKNKNNKKAKSRPKQKPAPNIFEEGVKEFKKGKEEVSPPTEIPTTLPTNKTIKKTYKNEIPEEFFAAQKRKIQREKAMKASRNEKFKELENERVLLDSFDFQQADLQKMVIFTEIFKRPNF